MFWWHACVGYYRNRNAHRSLEHAIQREKEWDLIKPKEEEYDDEDYGEESPAEVSESHWPTEPDVNPDDPVFDEDEGDDE